MNSQPNTIFGLLDRARNSLLDRLTPHKPVDEGHTYPWFNRVWTSDKFRRAHLDIVDARETKKLYMMHLTVMPHLNDGAPVFGFDLIAGPNKVTGAFHDFSPINRQHPMLDWFGDSVSSCQWSKQRELPEWAKQIFSNHMVAAGNISDSDELRSIITLVLNNLDYYLDTVGYKGKRVYKAEQNAYCHWQKQNPHTPRVMQALGYDEETVHDFIQKCLFPEI
jgi:hypothetical protein